MPGQGACAGPAYFTTPRCAMWASVTLERKVVTCLQSLTCVFAYDSHLLVPVESGQLGGSFFTRLHV